MTKAIHPQPTPQLLASLRRGKDELHAFRRSLPLAEKVRLVIELQGIALPLIARRRPLEAIERQWPLRSEDGSEG